MKQIQHELHATCKTVGPNILFFIVFWLGLCRSDQVSNTELSETDENVEFSVYPIWTLIPYVSKSIHTFI